MEIEKTVTFKSKGMTITINADGSLILDFDSCDTTISLSLDQSGYFRALYDEAMKVRTDIIRENERLNLPSQRD